MRFERFNHGNNGVVAKNAVAPIIQDGLICNSNRRNMKCPIHTVEFDIDLAFLVADVRYARRTNAICNENIIADP